MQKENVNVKNSYEDFIIRSSWFMFLSIFVALKLVSAAISARFERDIARISMKRDKMNAGLVSEHVHTSYKQRWCSFRLKFGTSGDITLKLSPNRTEIVPDLHARLGDANLANQKLHQKSPVQMGHRWSKIYYASISNQDMFSVE